MTVTDPIADMLARIRNAMAVNKSQTQIPWSKMKYEILKLLVREGYLEGVEVAEENGFKILIAQLKYNQGKSAIRHMKRRSKPGRRVYVKNDNIPYVLNGMGICILSTSKGMKTDMEARRARIGGELICEVW